MVNNIKNDAIKGYLINIYENFIEGKFNFSEVERFTSMELYLRSFF